MRTWEKKNIDRWSGTVQNFSSVPTESGAKYPPVLSAWVHALETKILEQRTKPALPDAMLDLGAGGGRFSTYFAARCGSVTAVEPSDLINVLRANTAPFANVQCLHQRIQDITFTEEFRIVLISGVLMYMPHEEAGLSLGLAAKALKPGGILVLREPVARKGIINVNWKYYPQGSEPDISDDTYFEHYRDFSFYRDTCLSHGLRLTGTTISHAPVFYFLPEGFPFKATIQKTMLFLLQAPWSVPLMEIYNSVMKHPYAAIMDLFKKKTMRFHFFIK